MVLQVDDLKPFIDWLQANPSLAVFGVFLISCAESLALVGLFIPGTIVMPAIGSMIGTGVLPADWIIGSAILGAILGDNLSYWLGYYYHGSIKKIWPFYRFPKLIYQGEVFFTKYGGLSVFIGRFVGPVRPIIPVVAGMMQMKPGRFLLANLTSAIAWAILYMAPGIVLGAISEQLAPHVAARLLVILAIITFLLWLCVWSLNKLWNHSHLRFEKFSQRLWLNCTKHYPNLQKIVHHYHLDNHKPLSIIFYILFFIVLLSIISFSVYHNGTLTFLDWPIFLFLRSIQVAPLDNLMAVLYRITTSTNLICLGIAPLLWFLLQRNWRTAIYWVANILSAWLISALLQHCIHLTSPIFGPTRVYPSMSLSVFAAIVGNFLLFSYYNKTWIYFKKPFALMMLGLIGLAALPNLYFGFYWVTGAIASLGCAAITTWCCVLFFYREKLIHMRLKLYLFIFALSLLLPLITNFNAVPHFLNQLEKPNFPINYSAQNWWDKQTLPITLYRTGFLGSVTESLPLQYGGNLKQLSHALQKQGWTIAPKASFTVILNRIGSKDRLGQLPIFPDLYHAQKPSLIMTKFNELHTQVLTLRLWSSEIALQPGNTPLWLGTIKFYHPWQWHRINNYPMRGELSLALKILQSDLAEYQTQYFDLSQQCPNPMLCPQEILKIKAVSNNANVEVDHDDT